METGLTANEIRGGLNLHFDLTTEAGSQSSPTWQTGGRQLQFHYLAPHHSLTLAEGENFAKVIKGRLHNLGLTCLAAPFSVRSTKVSTHELQAASEGALIATLNLPAGTPHEITQMEQVTFRGPQAERLRWQSFEQKFGGALDYFDGLDCHMADGFHLLDETGHEFCYVNPWTSGKGVDLSTHNHGHKPSSNAPAFAEVHWVAASGTDEGGMYETPEPGSGIRTQHSMNLGDEHGPL